MLFSAAHRAPKGLGPSSPPPALPPAPPAASGTPLARQGLREEGWGAWAGSRPHGRFFLPGEGTQHREGPVTAQHRGFWREAGPTWSCLSCHLTYRHLREASWTNLKKTAFQGRLRPQSPPPRPPSDGPKRVLATPQFPPQHPFPAAVARVSGSRVPGPVAIP